MPGNHPAEINRTVKSDLKMLSKQFLKYFFGLILLSSFLALLDSGNNLLAQSRQIVFRKITVEDGLSQNSVISISQDTTGMMWLATQDGLNKYNGIHFEKFNAYFYDITRPNFSRLGKIYIDIRENIWTLTSKGHINRLSPVDYTLVTFPEVREPNSILELEQKRLLVGTWGFGIYEYYPSSSQFLPVEGPLSRFSKDTLFTMYEDHGGKLWLATQRGLFSYDGNQISNWPLFSRNRIQVFPYIGGIADQPDGTIWLGSYGNGLFYKTRDSEIFMGYVPEQTDPYHSAIDYEKLNILDLLVDYKSRLWIATYGKGLFLLDGLNPPDNFQNQKNNPNAISYNDILTLYEDDNHVIWAGTDGGGASYYDENLHKFNVFKNAMVPPDVNMDVIRSILVDGEGSIWIGTSGKGLTRYFPDPVEKWNTYRKSDIQGEGPSNNRIMSLAEDVDGDIWIGTQGNGLDIFSRTTGKFKNHYNPRGSKVEIPDHTIWCIAPVDQGLCWLGTRNSGLILFDKFLGVLEHYLPDSSDRSISSSNIRTIIKDGNAGLWIGTEDRGLCRFDFETKSFLQYASNDSLDNTLSSNYIKCLYLDSARNTLWVGTSGGGLNALHLESGRFRIYTVENGLPNNVIYGILPDEDGNLWMSTNRGICKFTPPANLNQQPVIFIYDNYDGLQGLEFNTGAYYKDSNGYLYFGGIDGYNWFKPEDIEFNPIRPNTAIIGIDINDQSYATDTVIEKKTHLLLTYDQDAISFHFSALSFSMPARNIYQYKLTGYDDNWVYAGFRNFASYTNLDPGDYIFMVKGSNYDGVFANKPASIYITIQHAWWGTHWAYFIYGLLILVIGYTIYRIQKRRRQLQAALEYEQNEAERVKELDKFKSRVYANITHEFRTPITVIQGLTERAREYARKGQMARFTELIEIVRRNSERLLQLVNQILDLSKLESKSLKLDYVSGDIQAYIRYCVELFESYAISNGISLKVISKPENYVMDFDPDNLQKVLNNLVSNAIKFTPHEGSVTVETTVLKQDAGNQFQLRVKDTGIGIPEKDLPFIFDRFYQVSHDYPKKQEGSGIGLALTKELVQLMGGDIQVENSQEQGTDFIIRLPILHQATNIYAGKKKDLPFVSELIATRKESIQIDADLNAAKILLIEDNVDVLYYLKTCLLDQFQILEATHGQQGIDIAFDQIPDLIITDIMMPGMDGFEVCEKLKNNLHTSHIPVIMLTAKSTVLDRIEGLKAGADAYLYKPFNVEELTAQVENLLHIRKKLQEKFSLDQEKGSFKAYTPSREKQFLEKLHGLIENELTNPDLSVDKICDEMNMSRSQLHRKVKALTSKSITAYVRRYRLLIARDLIRQTDKTISEIAYEAGFSDPSYFHRSFQKEFGIRPGDVRNAS
jgi:signal transduction histidine kinase/ligand-binding sensor domain-containing protein/DNA-binding response OmpR family regulator